MTAYRHKEHNFQAPPPGAGRDKVCVNCGLRRASLVSDGGEHDNSECGVSEPLPTQHEYEPL